VRGLTLKCRIVMVPMATGLATQAGAVTERLIRHYVKRSKALGLLIVEHSYISLQGKLSKRQLGIHEDSLIPGLKKLVQSVQAMGTPIVAQINHAGAHTTKKVTRMPPVGPSERARSATTGGSIFKCSQQLWKERRATSYENIRIFRSISSFT